MSYDETKAYWIWLSSVEGVTPKRMAAVIDRFSSAKSVWNNASDASRMLPKSVGDKLRSARSAAYFDGLFRKLDELGIRAVTLNDDDYPERLSNIYDPPSTIFIRGENRLNDEKTFAIVGSRMTSFDGKRAATEISGGLAGAGVTVVSGLARGIDTFAHTGCLDKNGITVAVFGSGLDIIYPNENAALAKRIVDSGGALVSEYPPGTRPYAANFPVRNRIISGLSDGVLMVEGKRSSGAIHTVDYALDQGKNVFVVPGSIYSSLSEGTNRLLLDGATPVLCEWDILEWYRWAERPADNPRGNAKPELDPDEEIVVEMLKVQSLSFDEMLNACGFNSAKLNSLLTILELRGIIKQLPGRIYRA